MEGSSGVETMWTGGTLYPQVQDLYPLYPPSQRCGLCQNFKQTTLTTSLYKVLTNLPASEMTYTVSGGALNSTQTKLTNLYPPPTYENVPTRLERRGGKCLIGDNDGVCIGVVPSASSSPITQQLVPRGWGGSPTIV